MNSVLITGAAGMLGSVLTKVFDDCGWAVTRLHRMSQHSPRLGQKQIPSTSGSVRQADITNSDELKAGFRGRTFDLCVHCAAITNLKLCEELSDLAYQTHVLGTRNLLNVINPKQFVYISTDSVFDGTMGSYKESDIPNPQNTYASTKLKGEFEALQHGGAIVARLNLYDLRPTLGNSLAEWAYKQLSQDGPVLGYNNVFFNPLHTTQIGKILLALVNVKYSGVVHLGCDENVSKYAFIGQLATQLGFDETKVQASTYLPQAEGIVRPLNTVLSTARLKQILPDSDTSLEKGLLLLASEWRKHEFCN